VRAPLGPRDRSGARDCTPSVMTEVALDPFGSVGSLLGYVIGMLGIAMLVYIVWPEFFPAFRLIEAQPHIVMAAYGTPRRFAAVRRFGRDGSEADMPRASGAGRSDENDPNRTYLGFSMRFRLSR
jgi:hypothetical protein